MSNDGDNTPAIFGDRVMPEAPVIGQEHWNMLRLAGTLDEKRKHIFLRVLAETADPKLACQSAGYRNMGAINRALRDDVLFAAAYKEAAESAADMIEAEAVRRAVRGVKKAIYYKGELIDYEVVYSDTLLAILLRAAKPEKYADRSKTTTDVNVRVGVAVIPPKAKSVKAWEAEAIVVRAAQQALESPKDVVDAEFQEVDGAVQIQRG